MYFKEIYTMSQVEIVIDDGSLVKITKNLLSSNGKLDRSKKIKKNENGFIISTLYESIDQIDLLGLRENDHIKLQLVDRKVDEDSSASRIETIVRAYLEELNIESNDLMSKVPKKYTLYPPLLLINNQNTFECKEWEDHFHKYPSSDFYNRLLSHFPQITHVAINKPIIEEDVMRRPFNIYPLYGDFGPVSSTQMFDEPTQDDFKKAFWCTVVQNGIFQTWAPRYTMFSRGNVKEKARVLSFKGVRNTTVVDMYAGIGYFTLSYLKLGAKVFCFEINPWSIQGLIRGLIENGFSYRVVGRDDIIDWDENIQCWIFNESNEYAVDRLEQTGQTFNISHVNMGLLPSSKQSWPHTIKLVKEFSNSNTMIHIHENKPIEDLSSFMDLTVLELEQLASSNGTHKALAVAPVHLEKIKTFAPGVWHICADFELAFAK